MQRVRLETRDGGFVASGQIPPFNQTPNVVIWGVRVFEKTDVIHEGALVYREGFAVYLAILEEKDPGQAALPGIG